MQSLSGTGALRVGAQFLSKNLPKGTPLYISDPTWPNHDRIFQDGGFEKQIPYPYYEAKTNSLAFGPMMEGIAKAPPGSVLVLHACAHNPTGIDPTKEQWKEIAALCLKNKLIPFMDLAYQGYATGDLDNDAYSVRLFAEMGIQFLVAESFAKNMGLYGERVGALHIVCANETEAENILSNIKLDIRGMYSNPPAHGARIVARILKNPKYSALWKSELKLVSGRIQAMRKLLYDELVALKTPGTWEHLFNQIGMFSYTSLSEAQCDFLAEEKHVYLLRSGRASIAGINSGNVKYLAASINEAVIKFPKA